MTPNDAQIDLLLRAYSRKTGPSATEDDASGRGGTHLDADELSAFADGALPPATSARYVSHLADCDDCRKLATQLTIAAGESVPLRVQAATEISRQASPWRRFRDLFAAPNLRYAAFALIVIAAVGITFVALRRQSDNSLLAQRTTAPPSGDAATQVPAAGAPAASSADRQTASKSPSAPDSLEKSKSLDTSAAPPPPPLKETDLAKNAPVPSKRAESEVAEAPPSYAPAPPGERSEPSASVGGLKAGVATAQPAEPKKADDNFRMSDRARADENARARQMEIDRAGQRKGGPSRNESSNRSNVANQESAAASRGERRDKSEETQDQSRTQGLLMAESDERKVGGRSFRRQGGAWVDKKFKSSMAVTDIRRGSEEFRALDSDLRSIAGQLTGEIVVVWKSKAYRIH
jgi:Putative zinc-finger